MVSGKVISKEKQEVVDFATVYLKGTTYGCTTNEEGIYHLHAPAGKYTLVVSAIGYKTIEKPVTLVHGERIKMNVMIDPSVTELGEVVVVSNGVSRVKRSAFNAIAVDTKEFQNSTKNLSDALAKAPGMKLRESGGVGSDMQLMLDGFSGKHVKIFIDGVPQEGVGSSFGLNNIPVNFADRIEVYKGVVPVGFGTDAIGGVINIVTNKKKRNWFLDGSYSYGSFNTHKSYVNFGQTFKNVPMMPIKSGDLSRLTSPARGLMTTGSLPLCLLRERSCSIRISVRAGSRIKLRLPNRIIIKYIWPIMMSRLKLLRPAVRRCFVSLFLRVRTLM